MTSFSTEVTSSKITSDKPLYQRTNKAYKIIADNVEGDTLEIGCGEGYGISSYIDNTTSLTLIDKSKNNLDHIKKEYPNCVFYAKKIPPLAFINDNSFDTVISFQVMEHIKDYNYFLNEIKRILKPNGTAYITTPNKEKTIAPNPWHYTEFSYGELDQLFKPIFSEYTIMGIEGNEKAEGYYLKSNASVKKILSYDILKLHKRLPRVVLRIPYELLNRVNRLSLLKNNNNLIESIHLSDYALKPCSHKTLDFFCTLRK